MIDNEELEDVLDTEDEIDNDIEEEELDDSPEEGKKGLEGDEVEEGEEPKEEDPEDEETYGKKVLKRIGREVKKTKLIERERDIARSELNKSLREHAELRIKFNESEKKRLEYKVEHLKKSATAALDDGETEEYITLNDEMLDAKVSLSRVEDEVIEVPETEVEESGMAPAAESWLSKNRSWTDSDPAKFSRAKRLSRVLRSEGYDVRDQEMYDELDRRLNKKPERRTQTSHIPNSSAARNEQKKDGMTSEDKKLMRKFHLNPDKASDRKAWLEGKS